RYQTDRLLFGAWKITSSGVKDPFSRFCTGRARHRKSYPLRRLWNQSIYPQRCWKNRFSEIERQLLTGHWLDLYVSFTVRISHLALVNGQGGICLVDLDANVEFCQWSLRNHQPRKGTVRHTRGSYLLDDRSGICG